MVNLFQRLLIGAAALAFALAAAGCASISEHTHAYVGAPKYPPAKPEQVKILPSEPSQPRDRLGEILLTIDGNPSPEAVDKKLRQGGATLGADAVFVVYDKMHLYPIVYGGWGPAGVSQEALRNVVAVAIKYK